MNRLRKICRIIDIIVFLAATLAIMGVFYEGMTLKWYAVVGGLVACMDYSFLAATVIHLIVDPKGKNKRIHYFSLDMLVIAIVMKIAGLEYPALALVFWFFYIWFQYGIINIRHLKNMTAAIQQKER